MTITGKRNTAGDVLMYVNPGENQFDYTLYTKANGEMISFQGEASINEESWEVVEYSELIAPLGNVEGYSGSSLEQIIIANMHLLYLNNVAVNQ